MYHSEIPWGDSTMKIEKKSLDDLIFWLTNLYDATGRTPDVFTESGELLKIRYDARGRAHLA